MSHEVANHEVPVKKRHNGLAVILIAIGALLLVVNLTIMTIGRIATGVARGIDDTIVLRAVDIDGNEFVIDDVDQIVEADLARVEARIDAQADRIEAAAEANAARIEAEAERIEQRVDRMVIPAVEDIRINRAGPRFVFGPFGPRFNRGPNLWGAALLLLGLYFITRNRKQAQAAPATGPEADPPAAA